MQQNPDANRAAGMQRLGCLKIKSEGAAFGSSRRACEESEESASDDSYSLAGARSHSHGGSPYAGGRECGISFCGQQSSVRPARLRVVRFGNDRVFAESAAVRAGLGQAMKSANFLASVVGKAHRREWTQWPNLI